jgi:hypothetical protein
VWKFFVEMASQSEALAAIKGLNEHIVFKNGSKMNVYFS